MEHKQLPKFLWPCVNPKAIICPMCNNPRVESADVKAFQVAEYDCFDECPFGPNVRLGKNPANHVKRATFRKMVSNFKYFNHVGQQVLESHLILMVVGWRLVSFGWILWAIEMPWLCWFPFGFLGSRGPCADLKISSGVSWTKWRARRWSRISWESLRRHLEPSKGVDGVGWLS